MSHWSTEPILHSHALVGLLAAGLLALLFVRPYKKLSRRRRLLLAVPRVLLILLLTVVMLRPTHISTSTQKQSAVVLILFDKSLSMTLPNTSGGLSRWEAQRKLLKEVEPILKEFGEDLDVKIYAYDRQLDPLARSAAGIAFPDAVDGSQTDIGSCLYDAVRREQGKRLAAVFLLGDGTQTAYDPAVEIPQAGRELARQGVPLYTVGFGPTGDAQQSRDIAVENLPEQYTVFVKNELPVSGVLRVRGFLNKDIPVELVVQSPDGREEVVQRQILRAQQDNQQVPIRMKYTPADPGQYTLTLRAEKQPAELVGRNNELTAWLTVLEGGLRVLYLEGELRQEQMFVRASINASPDMQLDFQWIERGTRPGNLEAAIVDGQYDVIVLGDLDSTLLGDENLKLLRQAVERGTGLIALGGYHSFGAGSYQDSPLADVLPVKMGKFERQDFDAPIRADLHLEGPLPMRPTEPHPTTRLADDNASAWRMLMPLKGANRIQSVKISPGVRVLAESAKGDPLLISGEFGQGRVLAFLADSTWQWWRTGRQAEHKRFWRQVVLWLAHRDGLDKEEVWIRLRQRRFNPGSQVTFTAGARSSTGTALTGATFQCELIDQEGERSPLNLSTDGDHMRGIIDSIREPGEYEIEVTATFDGKSLGSDRTSFRVLNRDIELSMPASDRAQLARLAALTKDAGGRMAAAEEVPAIFREMQKRPPELEIEVQERWQLGDAPVGAWLIFLAMVGLSGLEWFWRKRWGLV